MLLRRTQNLSSEAVSRLLAANLPALEADLDEGVIVVITDTVIRVRRLPVMPA